MAMPQSVMIAYAGLSEALTNTPSNFHTPPNSSIGTFDHQGMPDGYQSACDTDHSNPSVLFSALTSYALTPHVTCF